MTNEPLDLVRCLYKLHFQLLLLLESFGKLLRLISQSNQDLATDKSRELALIQNELKKAIKELPATAEPKQVEERSPSPELDPTVESGVGDLNRIRIDDMEDEPTVPDAEAEAEATNKELTEAAKAVVESAGSQGSGSTTDSDSSINNKSSESFTDTISADSSMNAKEESELNNQLPAESEAKIVDLITDSKWSEAIKAYRIHKTRWPGTLPILASQVIGNTSVDDDIGAMLNLFCAALAEKSAGIFVMTLTDMDIAESCSRLMEAIQQLSQTIKQLESFHVKQQQQKLKTIVTSPMGGPPPLPALPASTPSEVPVSPSVPVAETAVASASTAVASAL